MNDTITDRLGGLLDSGEPLLSDQEIGWLTEDGAQILFIHRYGTGDGASDRFSVTVLLGEDDLGFDRSPVIGLVNDRQSRKIYSDLFHLGLREKVYASWPAEVQQHVTYRHLPFEWHTPENVMDQPEMAKRVWIMSKGDVVMPRQITEDELITNCEAKYGKAAQ